MHKIAAVAPLLLTAATFAQVPTVHRDTIWVETVKGGDMPVSVRGRGVVTSDRTAELRVPESLAGNVEPGQQVSIDAPTATGKVSRVGPGVVNGTVAVMVDLDRALPPSSSAGAVLDGTIHVTTLSNIAYVGRPVSCRPDSEGLLFKLEPGGREATRVKVRYGHFGHTPAKVVQIREGLTPGDQVIASDMSAFAKQERVRLE
jgi:HlyD family secretion protein